MSSSVNTVWSPVLWVPIMPYMLIHRCHLKLPVGESASAMSTLLSDDMAACCMNMAYRPSSLT